MKLFQRINEQLSSPEIKLFCQIPISDIEYSELLEYTRKRISNLYFQTIPAPDVMLSMALVQIAIQKYIGGNYWDYFLEELNMNVSATKRNYLGQIFISTLRHFNLFEIEREEKSRYAYVENIKAHAFVPNNYLFGYFDFLFSFYDRNLFRQLPDDLEDNIYELIDFMVDSLSSNSDNVGIENYGNKPVKSYRLLKATKNVIAQCSPITVCNLISEHLKLIDDYYYDGKVLTNDDRLFYAFIYWSGAKDSEINSEPNLNKHRRRLGVFYHKPYFEIDRSSGQAFIVIPSQKIREEEFNGNVIVLIEYDDQTIKKQLNMYRAYGVIVSEQLKVPVNNIFTSFNIEIISGSTRSFKIPYKEYRIFNEAFEELEKLKKGQCYILVKKDLSVRSILQAVYVNIYHPLWNEYSYSNITDDSVIYINNRPVSILGQFSEEPLFEYVSKEYLLFIGEQKIQTAYHHPNVSFMVAKNALKGTFIWCNNNRYNAKIEGISSVIEFMNDSENCGVSIGLSNILEDEDGYYQIWVDEPGKSRKLICQYVLITSLRCRPEKPRFIFCDKALIHILGDYDITPLNCEQVNDYEYSLDLTTGIEEAKFELSLGESNYTLIVPIKVFKYGFSRQWNYRREKYLWHMDLKNDLFISMPGATQAFVYFGKNDEDKIEGEMQKDGEFQFDISNFVNRIKESSSSFVYINLKFFDNKWRKLSLLRVMRKLWFNKFYMEYSNNMISIISEYEGDAKLKARISDFATDEIVSEKYLKNGSTEFPELNRDSLYRLEKFEATPDPFGFSENLTSIGVIYKIGAIDYKDVSNCKMRIKAVTRDDVPLSLDYIYTVYDLSKIAELTYTGKLTSKPKSANRSTEKSKEETLFEKIRIGMLLENGELHILSIHIREDDDWVEVWYDSLDRKLISANDNILFHSKDYERFIPLYEDITEYKIEFGRVR
jgi:hypothetical protein